MTVFRDLSELRDDLEMAGSLPAWREPSTAIGRQVQKLAAEVDAQRATNERLTAEIDRLRAASAAVVAAWDDDEIGRIDGALIDALRGGR